nr:angiopoietin-2-like [Drosophila takahashii]
MSPDKLNNLSLSSQGSSQESIDNNFDSCDIDIAIRTREQDRIIRRLNERIIFLERKLEDSERSCINQRERNDLFAGKIKDKEDIIKSLNASIELTKKYNDYKMKQMHDELKKALELSNNQNITKSSEVKYEKQISEIPEIPGLEDFEAVFQDIPSAGSGWMVIQRRIDGSVSFSEMELDHDYNYKAGFGNIKGEFWIGCEKLHLLTTSQRHEFNLNGYYHESETILTDNNGIWWGNWNKRGRSSLKACKMFIRPMQN